MYAPLPALTAFSGVEQPPITIMQRAAELALQISRSLLVVYLKGNEKPMRFM